MDHLSYTNRRWLIDPDDAALPVQSGQELVERLAQERGVQFSTGAGAFELSPPEVFPEMRQAVERIHTAMEQRQHIVIFGDYDCDGITAAAQLARYFRRHDARHTVRLPHRVHDGYGVQPALVEELITKNVDLVITVDTGITAAPEIAALCDAGIDVIVTDHHAPGTTLPKATAVLHPDLAPDLATPAPSGSGVAHALLRALEGAPWQGMHVDRILAMLGTVADMVPLTGENRILVQRGLLACRDLTPGEPLHDLLLQADVDPARASSTDIAFRIAPRINAAGRMDCPTVALEALLDGGTAVENLHALNRSRQLATEDALAAAMAEYADGDTPPLLASLNAEYEHGIIGLIAGRLTEAFGKPSMVATYDQAFIITLIP